MVKAFDGLLPETQDALDLVLKEGLLKIHSTAVKSIQASQSKGRTYKRGNVTHTASAPGNPPNTDTGRLVKSIAWEYDRSSLTGAVGTNLTYGAFLELVMDRPWLKPAYDEHIGAIVKDFEKEVLKGLRKAARKK